MTKSTRANESSSSEVRELRERMQKMLLEVGTLAKEVSNLKKLDQMMLERKEQMTSNIVNHRDKIPTREDKIPVGGRQSKEQSHNNFINHNSHYYSQWSTMEFLKFSGEDLKSWLFRIDQLFNMENIPVKEKVSIAALQLEALVERFGVDSPKKLVSFEISNLSHFYPQETSIKTTSYTCKVLDEMSKRDLDVDSLYSGTTERNNKTEAFGDLFFDAFFIDNESDVKAFEIMLLG
ncbi:hypothetical protein H5410_037966 [Solanum commersonii]|uniref:Uncharacterized protein n=1 Tax=Solanum commersonii TaxID=4109 RepID=A0A9J5YCM3_SOLCO|nr:hypothetical protein H5410_037966 [Solanum commersonii]